MLGNDTKINSNLQQVQEPTNYISKSVSEASRSPLKTAEQSEEYNIPSNQNKAQNAEANATFTKQHNFKTLARIPEEERIEIIQTGFRLNQEGKISLKKYYESTDPYSLFKRKGYSIKYESIRRTKLYQQLKP